MNLRILLASALFAAGVSASPVLAAQSHTRPSLAMTTFQIQVVGAPDRAATYWIAYGPLDGKFGIVQLQQRRHGVFSANLRLPTSGKSVFTYIAGHGVVHTRLGLEPGSPVLTVRQFGPTSIWPRGIPAVRWQPPTR